MNVKVSLLFLLQAITAIVFTVSLKSLHINEDMWQFWTILISYIITILGWTYIGKEYDKNEQ